MSISATLNAPSQILIAEDSATQAQRLQHILEQHHLRQQRSLGISGALGQQRAVGIECVVGEQRALGQQRTVGQQCPLGQQLLRRRKIEALRLKREPEPRRPKTKNSLVPLGTRFRWRIRCRVSFQ